jgi:hypothetical protein
MILITLISLQDHHTNVRRKGKKKKENSRYGVSRCHDVILDLFFVCFLFYFNPILLVIYNRWNASGA